jgi:hypothetical protein
MTQQGFPFADCIRDRITVAMGYLRGAAQTVKLRKVTETGGDGLLGIRGTVTNADTTIDPPPFVTNVSLQEIQASNGVLQTGDLALLVPPGIAKTDLEASLYVIGTDVYQFIRLDEWPAAEGVLWSRVLIRKKHTVGQER